jgi:hypothetical protein
MTDKFELYPKTNEEWLAWKTIMSVHCLEALNSNPEITCEEFLNQILYNGPKSLQYYACSIFYAHKSILSAKEEMSKHFGKV